MTAPAASSRQVALLRRLAEGLAAPPTGEAGGEIPAAHYVSDERFVRERERVFGRLPTIVAHESELPPGSCLEARVAGTSALVARAEDGTLAAFRNACRHRSTELVPAGTSCPKKAIVCPYHGWTYDLAGRLIHVPHQASFRGADAGRASLAGLHAAVAHGFVWVSLLPFDTSSWLASIASELGPLSATGTVLFRRADVEVAANWKLLVDAFLDGYHIRHLHRETVYRFFHDARSLAEHESPHIRALSARRALHRHLDGDELAEADLRRLATPSYLVFPNTVLVFHPDFVSVMAMVPVAPSRTRFVHWMLAPEPVRTPEAQAHLSKSFALIHEGVFVREDLAIAEAMQRGLANGGDDGATLLFGDLESPALWFHGDLDDALRG